MTGKLRRQALGRINPDAANSRELIKIDEMLQFHTRWRYSISTSAPFNQSPTGSPKIMPTWLNRQHFAMFLLSRHYNNLDFQGNTLKIENCCQIPLHKNLCYEEKRRNPSFALKPTVCSLATKSEDDVINQYRQEKGNVLHQEWESRQRPVQAPLLENNEAKTGLMASIQQLKAAQSGSRIYSFCTQFPAKSIYSTKTKLDKKKGNHLEKRTRIN
ncbi:hypothetical protein TNCV_1441711 [Trichonephila clavipes]|uniref:Uncharacterized protein n=1 Tax=Trichonephila clavipes TaxID=2585209 RepID=A0A8X6V693_TRICX|nr:hypothetical protein TNCV_1441711 [Trichonephila clavipes]